MTEKFTKKNNTLFSWWRLLSSFLSALKILSALAVSTVFFCLLTFSTNLFVTHWRPDGRKNYERLVATLFLFCLVCFKCNCFFFYNGLKQGLILQTKPNLLLQISFFSYESYLYLLWKSMWRDLGTSLQLCSSHLLASPILILKFALYQGHVPRLTRKKKQTKFVYFVETANVWMFDILS